MADDSNEQDYRDRDRINVNEDYELRYWSDKFGISHDRLKELVRQHGPMVKDIERALKK
jgi:hypothetical protein